MTARGRPQQIADSVYLVAGTNTNWVLVTDGDDVLVIDGGYPGDRAAVEASIDRIGRNPSGVTAVLLTHAHLDHIGAVPWLAERAGCPVWCSADEVAHARREHTEGMGGRDLLASAVRPGGLRWVAASIRVVGRRAGMSVPTATAFPSDGPLDLPGTPVPVPTPGHTTGHSCYLLPRVGVVVSGDALVTGHPLSRTTGPQLLPEVFNENEDRTAAALSVIAALPGGTLLPGHGPAHRGPMADAVAAALAAPRRTDA